MGRRPTAYAVGYCLSRLPALALDGAGSLAHVTTLGCLALLTELSFAQAKMTENQVGLKKTWLRSRALALNK